MAGAYDGSYSDGRTAAMHEVVAQARGDGLHINSKTGDFEEHWRYGDVRAIDPPRSDIPFRLTSQTMPDARLSVNSAEFVADLRHQAPQLFLTGLAQPTLRRNIALIILALCALGLLLWQGMPHLSAPLAHLVPAQWAQNIGETYRSRIISGAPVCNDASGTAALAVMTRRLTNSLSPPLNVDVIVADKAQVNAFALPGGHIVIMRGLLEKAGSSDEVAAILAHEIGHVSHRHPLQMGIHVAGIGMMVDLFTGEGSSLMEMAGEGGGLLLLLNYSRDMEREADAYGRKLMGTAGLSTGAMARFFARLKPEGKKGGNGAENGGGYFSSHPPLEERIDAATKLETGQSVLNNADWMALKNICG